MEQLPETSLIFDDADMSKEAPLDSALRDGGGFADMSDRCGARCNHFLLVSRW